MLEFVRNWFRRGVSALLWIIVIGFAVIGYLYGDTEGHPFLYGLLGVIIGVVIDVCGGGFIATILNIDENLQKLVNKS